MWLCALHFPLDIYQYKPVQTAVHQLFHGTALVLSPTESGYSQILFLFHIPFEDETSEFDKTIVEVLLLVMS